MGDKKGVIFLYQSLLHLVIFQERKHQVFLSKYQSSNTDNRLQTFNSLSITAIKPTKQNVKLLQFVLYQPFGCPKTNFGPLARRQSNSLGVNYNANSSLTQKSPEAL